MMRKRLVLVLLVAAFVALVPAPAEATKIDRICVPVHATGVGQDHGNGQTTATIFVRGVEVGTTAANFTISGVEGTVASFTGPLIFTSDIGTITVQTAGTLDTATGRFAARSTDLTGTGALSGVTGRLVFRGTEDLAAASFTERISGRLCLPR
jgi:hypothetical protein